MIYNKLILVFWLCITLSLSSCSLNKFATKMVANALTSAGDSTVFTGDNDPQLIEDSLPFVLKLYESLLTQIPEDIELNQATGSAFIMYANAFVHTKANMLSDSEFEKKEKMLARAKKLYLRGRNYGLTAMEVKYPGFKKLLEEGKTDQALKQVKKEDVPLLYWIAAGWFAAYSTDAFDVEISATVNRALALMKKALELDEAYSDGAIHEFFIAYYGGMPESMGGSEKKARIHFKRALELSKNLKASPYVSLATSISIKNQNVKEFRSLLGKALEIDVDAVPSFRLANIIAQKEAQWYLDHIDDKFLDSK